MTDEEKTKLSEAEATIERLNTELAEKNKELESNTVVALNVANEAKTKASEQSKTLTTEKNKLAGLSNYDDTEIKAEKGVSIRKRGNTIFVMNFADTEKELVLDREYKDVINGKNISGKVTLNVCEYLVIE